MGGIFMLFFGGGGGGGGEEEKVIKQGKMPSVTFCTRLFLMGIPLVD